MAARQTIQARIVGSLCTNLDRTQGEENTGRVYMVLVGYFSAGVWIHRWIPQLVRYVPFCKQGSIVLREKLIVHLSDVL